MFISIWIHALQLVAEYVSSNNSRYSYELNLVPNNGKRVTVVDHGNLVRIREDGKARPFPLQAVLDGTAG